MPVHASRWSARAQKSLFLPLSVLFPRFAANSFFPSLPFFPLVLRLRLVVRVRCAFCGFFESRRGSSSPVVFPSFSATFSGVQLAMTALRFSKFHFRGFLIGNFSDARGSFQNFPRDYDDAPPRPRRVGMIIDSLD